MSPCLRRIAALTLLLTAGRSSAGQAAGLDAESLLCAANPAFSPDVMRSVIEAQLQHDHDPSLDEVAPDKLARQAVAQGVRECADALRRAPGAYQALSALKGNDVQVGWDAYNVACADHKASLGACITAEVGSARALKRMMATNTPPGAKSLIETCALVLQTDAPMADWRQCVDLGLAVHADEAIAKSCKLSVSWHTAKTGAQAGHVLAQCLSKSAG